MTRAAGKLLGVALAGGLASVAARITRLRCMTPDKTYVMTGIVTRVDPNPNHLQIFFAPLNEARDQVLRDDTGEPFVWAVEMDGAAGRGPRRHQRQRLSARDDHQCRPASAAQRVCGRRPRQIGLFKCPADTPPAPGKHCDSVKGSTRHGEGELPLPTGEAPAQPKR